VIRSLYVNEIWSADKEVVRGFIVVEKTIIENLRLLFDAKLQNGIKHLITTEPTKSDGFHFFTKFCQFVVYFQYDTKKVVIGNTLYQMGIAIEVMFFGTSDNVNDTFDYMLKLRKSGWGEESRDEILELAHQIKKDMHDVNFEIAELIIKDPYNSPSSYS